MRTRIHNRPLLLVKRLTDIFVSSVGLLVFSPVIVGVSLAILVRLGRPTLFRQQRPGYNGQPFYVYKFRTMISQTERDGIPLNDAQRLTPLGRIIRQLSLDELPQLWNVLKGDMSLIGPRPLLMEYLPLYTPEQMRRHDMRPGITGLAQVSGRNEVPWEKKFELDVWYVDHWSLWLDMKIFVLTIQKVLKGEGVSGRGVATMTKFTGEKDDA